MEWQPIETAPRDGTNILIYVPRAAEAGDMATVHWHARGWHASDGAWVSTYGEVGHDEWYASDPTHWMPLPPPPGER